MRKGDLHFEIDLCIDVGSVKRHMSQPGTNSVDINTRSQKMESGLMPNSMGSDAFFAKRRHGDPSLTGVAFDQRMDSESSDRLFATI